MLQGAISFYFLVTRKQLYNYLGESVLTALTSKLFIQVGLTWVTVTTNTVMEGDNVFLKDSQFGLAKFKFMKT